MEFYLQDPRQLKKTSSQQSDVDKQSANTGGSIDGFVGSAIPGLRPTKPAVPPGDLAQSGWIKGAA